jgi:predicted nicotinamide N-methyase
LLGDVAAEQALVVVMEEVCDVACAPLFGETTCTYYSIAGTGRMVSSKTRDISSLKNAENSAHSLFADNLWPGCFVLADILACNAHLCRAKYSLELGAGSALPSLVAAALGAKKVIISDYPEESVMANIEENIRQNRLSDNTIAQSHAWGESVEPLLALIQRPAARDVQVKFDLLLCAELLWKDTYSLHDKLLQSISQSLCRSTGLAIVTFVHRPAEGHTRVNDLEFFSRAERDHGLRYKHLGVVSTYKDCLDDSDAPAEVQVYALYFEADISDLIV